MFPNFRLLFPFPVLIFIFFHSSLRYFFDSFVFHFCSAISVRIRRFFPSGQFASVWNVYHNRRPLLPLRALCRVCLQMCLVLSLLALLLLIKLHNLDVHLFADHLLQIPQSFLWIFVLHHLVLSSSSSDSTNSFTFTFLLRCLESFEALRDGRLLHGQVGKNNRITRENITPQRNRVDTPRPPPPLTLSLFCLPLSFSLHHLFMETFQDEAHEEHILMEDVNHENASEVKTKIRIRNLIKASDKGVPILRRINLEIPKGVIMGVIGPSGSGKSTMLRALNRLWEPPSGTVFLDGHDMSHLDVLALRRKVGMLFQHPVLFEGTVADNIRYGPQLRGKKLSDNEVHKLLALADLETSFFNTPGCELSVGQAQRVALARTLANQPEVLLLDEPTSALDPISTQNIEDVLVKLKNNRGMTIIMVSHSIKQVQRIADVVCLLVNGEIVESLKPEQLSESKHPMALRFLQLSS